MDQTETFIRMCEKAWQIQKPMPCIEDGDYYWWSVTGKAHLSYTESHNDYKVHHPEEWDWLRGRSIIWLPRQGQLQEMLMPSRYKEKYDMCSAFAAFLCDKPDIMSMEQLWLIFAMQQLYGKVWNGEDWIPQ